MKKFVLVMLVLLAMFVPAYVVNAQTAVPISVIEDFIGDVNTGIWTFTGAGATNALGTNASIKASSTLASGIVYITTETNTASGSLALKTVKLYNAMSFDIRFKVSSTNGYAMNLLDMQLNATNRVRLYVTNQGASGYINLQGWGNSSWHLGATNAGKFTNMATTRRITSTNWQRLVVTYDTTTIKIRLNGGAILSVTKGTKFPSTTTLFSFTPFYFKNLVTTEDKKVWIDYIKVSAIR